MTDDNQILRLIEALLFASAGPLEEAQLARKCPEGTDVRTVLAKLQELYAHRGVNLVHVGRRWAFRTAPDLKDELATETTVLRRLSRAAVETLALIAYHQPITRAEIESVRGVMLSRGTLDVLFEEGWIEPRGRRHTPGRPLTWGTTQAFLDHFGLESIGDLPGIEDLRTAGLLAPMPLPLGPSAGRSADGEPVPEAYEEAMVQVHRSGSVRPSEDEDEEAGASLDADEISEKDEVKGQRPEADEPAKAASEPGRI